MISPKAKFMRFHFLLILINLTLLTPGCVPSDPSIGTRPSVSSSVDNSNGNGDGSSEETPPTDGTPDANPDEKRPTHQVFIERDYCACLAGKPDIINNCANFCSCRSDEIPTLYAKVNLGSDILNNPSLGNLWAWCSVQINDTEQNPKCQLELWDGASYIYIDVTIPENSNNFSVNISGLSKNTTYVATLVETGSGSNVRSESFQIRRKNFTDLTYGGPLKVTPINRYTCVTRSGTSESDPISGNYETYSYGFTLYYYFPEGNDPPTIPQEQAFVFCHDIQKYGADDNVHFPRLWLQENDFYLWDESDLRFYDQDGDGKLDINNYIQNRLLQDFGQKSSISVFNEQVWESYPNIAVSGSSGSTGTETKSLPRLGFTMTPWTDPKTGNSFCPTQKQYDSNNAVFKILKDVVGVDTEGLYLGIREPVKMVDKTGKTVNAPEARILIREGLLKKIWFYYKNGVHVKPDQTMQANKTLMFYWPADPDYPYIKKASQNTYTVRHPQKTASSSGIRPNVLPTDSKMSCIPSPEENNNLYD